MLDAWPLVRFWAGDTLVRTEIHELLKDPLPTIVCSINLGEAHYVISRRDGFAAADEIWNYFCHNSRVEPPTLEVTYSAARLALTSRLPWADAHAAATALAFGAEVWAGDKHLNKPGPWKRRDLRKLGGNLREGHEK